MCHRLKLQKKFTKVIHEGKLYFLSSAETVEFTLLQNSANLFIFFFFFFFDKWQFIHGYTKGLRPFLFFFYSPGVLCTDTTNVLGLFSNITSYSGKIDFLFQGALLYL